MAAEEAEKENMAREMQQLLDEANEAATYDQQGQLIVYSGVYIVFFLGERGEGRSNFMSFRKVFLIREEKIKGK